MSAVRDTLEPVHTGGAMGAGLPGGDDVGTSRRSGDAVWH